MVVFQNGFVKTGVMVYKTRVEGFGAPSTRLLVPEKYQQRAANAFKPFASLFTAQSLRHARNALRNTRLGCGGGRRAHVGYPCAHRACCALHTATAEV